MFLVKFLESPDTQVLWGWDATPLHAMLERPPPSLPLPCVRKVHVYLHTYVNMPTEAQSRHIVSSPVAPHITYEVNL